MNCASPIRTSTDSMAMDFMAGHVQAMLAFQRRGRGGV